jgi:hypothetical protein
MVLEVIVIDLLLVAGDALLEGIPTQDSLLLIHECWGYCRSELETGFGDGGGDGAGLGGDGDRVGSGSDEGGGNGEGLGIGGLIEHLIDQMDLGMRPFVSPKEVCQMWSWEL